MSLFITFVQMGIDNEPNYGIIAILIGDRL